jgi:hypothetical protein
MSPATWAPITVAPSGSADVSATGVVCSFGAGWLGLAVGFGPTVGNRSEALPLPGFSMGGTLGTPGAPGMPGRLLTGSGEATVTGIGADWPSPACWPLPACWPAPVGWPARVGWPAVADGAVIDTATSAVGSLARCAVLPVTVRLTDVTADALTGTVSRACRSRGADFASTAPRSQEEVPSSLPQPKLNLGVPACAGAERRRRTASGTFPPVVQALIAHWAAFPRPLLG